RPASHWKKQRLSQPQNRSRHGVQIDDVSPDQVAQTGWANRMPEIIEAIAFKDGIKQLQNAA
ncbi:MAG: hypothetical protein ACJASV_003067, partial [Pseudorhodobacter sp.]